MKSAVERSGGRSLIFLNRFYWPEVAATGQMLTDLAEDLAWAGWSVTVVTSRSQYGNRPEALPTSEDRNGVHIVRIRSSRLGRQSHGGRIVDSASYLVGAFVELLRMPRADAVVAMSDPPLGLLLATAAAKLRGMATVYWPQDLYPELAVELGVLRRGGIIERVLARLNRLLYRRTDAVLALGPTMMERLVRAGARPDRVRVVHNWADPDEIRPIRREDNSFLQEHGLVGRFVVQYSGNAGRAHTFDALLDAMRRLRSEPDILFLFIGGGHQMESIRRRAAEAPGCRARFLGYQPRAALRHSLSAASVAVVTERQDVAGLLVPSKTYGILASGRPILFIGGEPSDVGAVVRDADCGFVIAEDDADGVVEAILRLRNDPALAAAMGRRAREAAERTYGRRIATDRWARELDGLVCTGSTQVSTASVPANPTGP